MGVAAGAFAQGKVTLINDNSHLLKYSTAVSDLRPSDAAKAGTAIVSAASPNNTWMMELWGNTSGSATEGQLAFLAGSVLPAGAPVAGRFNG
jgi:hypothetical protein